MLGDVRVPLSKASLGPTGGRALYLEAMGGRQAALFPEGQRALELLGRAEWESVGLVQATQQGQAGREAGQVVAT